MTLFTAEGNIEYWTCSSCGKCFSDANGNNEITKAQTVIPKLTPSNPSNPSNPSEPTNPSDTNNPSTSTNPSVAPAAQENVKTDLVAVRISKPKAAKKSVTVKWKKVSKKNLKKIQGIEIQVASDKGFTNIVKSTTAGKKKISKTIKGLKTKTKYWVRIRAYKNAADGKHVSAWKYKKIKTK